MVPESWLKVSRRSHVWDERPSQIERHKTAIRRKNFSLAVKCLLRDEVLDSSRTFFDYGCGHGEDVELLAAQGIKANGWDPAFRPNAARTPADIVNLGYVLNVIEDPQERIQALAEAWGLATQMLVVAARVNVEGRGYSQVEFGDGIVTSMGTFQTWSIEYPFFCPSFFCRCSHRLLPLSCVSSISWLRGPPPAACTPGFAKNNSAICNQIDSRAY